MGIVTTLNIHKQHTHTHTHTFFDHNAKKTRINLNIYTFFMFISENLNFISEFLFEYYKITIVCIQGPLHTSQFPGDATVTRVS